MKKVAYWATQRATPESSRGEDVLLRFESGKHCSIFSIVKVCRIVQSCCLPASAGYLNDLESIRERDYCRVWILQSSNAAVLTIDMELLSGDLKISCIAGSPLYDDMNHYCLERETLKIFGREF